MYTNGIFLKILLVGMGFEHWEVGFGENMGWEMGLEAPPSFRTLLLSSAEFICLGVVYRKVFWEELSRLT